MPLQVTPSPLTPSTDPQLGVESRHQGLHRCALDGFLAPSSEPRRSTRILRDLHSQGSYYSAGFPGVKAPDRGPAIRIMAACQPRTAWKPSLHSRDPAHWQTSGGSGSTPTTKAEAIMRMADRGHTAGSFSSLRAFERQATGKRRGKQRVIPSGVEGSADIRQGSRSLRPARRLRCASLRMMAPGMGLEYMGKRFTCNDFGLSDKMPPGPYRRPFL